MADSGFVHLAEANQISTTPQAFSEIFQSRQTFELYVKQFLAVPSLLFLTNAQASTHLNPLQLGKA